MNLSSRPKGHKDAFNHIFTYTALLYTKTGIFQSFFSPAPPFLKKIRISSFFVRNIIFFHFFITYSSHFRVIFFYVLNGVPNIHRPEIFLKYSAVSIIFHNSYLPAQTPNAGRYSPGITNFHPYEFSMPYISQHFSDRRCQHICCQKRHCMLRVFHVCIQCLLLVSTIFPDIS